MAEDRVDRRLAAIFAGDIAGYSRLMASNEEGTLRQLKARARCSTPRMPPGSHRH
jgi:adenylate cyclase